MGALFTIIAHSIGSMFIGVLLTIAGIVLMFVLIRSWIKGAEFTPISFIIGVILFFFLAFQSILICGAITIKSYSSDVEDGINKMVSYLPQDVELRRSDSQQILDNISEEWPLVGYYVNMADFHGHTPLTIAEAMVDELNSYMNWFILRRLGWSLLFIIIGAIAVIKSTSKSGRKHLKSTYTASEEVF